MMESDRMAIHAAARSFRMGAPITVDDIRFACWADGHPIDHVEGRYIAKCLAEICTHEHNVSHANVSWRLRA